MISVKEIEKILDFDYVMGKIVPLTPYGVEYKKKMKPYPKGAEKYLRTSLDILEFYYTVASNSEVKNKLRDILSRVKDTRFSVTRAEEEQVLTEVELYEIKILIFVLEDLKLLIEEHNFKEFFNTEITRILELEELLNPKGSNKGSFYLYDSYSPNISKIRRKRSEVENSYRRGIRSLRQEIKEEFDIVLNAENNVILSKNDEDKIQHVKSCPHMQFSTETYNTLVFSLKMPQELVKLQEEASILKRDEEEEEHCIRKFLTEEIEKHSKEIKKNINSIANLDLYLAKAIYAIDSKSVKPVILEEHTINIIDGRHPKIEDNLKALNLSFKPISIGLTEGVTCITGANMGGKTISLKIVGLLSLMAQFGLFVPAAYMELGLNGYIKLSIGDMQSTDSGLSTFGGEIESVVLAIGESDKEGLILIDELARGTNPAEGYAISMAIVEYLKNKKAITLLTTHFDRITHSEEIKHLQVVGLSELNFDDIDFREKDKLKIINKYMDYRLVEVSQFMEVPKDAINIARIMGLNEEIIQSAENIVKNGW